MEGKAGMAQVQINVRVPEEVARVLEAAAFVEYISLAELVRSHMEAAAADFAQQPAVRTALRAREEREATDSGKLRALPSRQSEGVEPNE
jgi:hypothetical protein